MRKKNILLTLVTGLFLILAFLSTVVVTHGWMVVLMQFGKPVKVIKDPGLHFKFPYPVNRAQRIDARLTLLSPKPSEFLTADKKNLILESSICYKIIDPVLFMKTVRDKIGLEVRLTDLLSSHTGLLLSVKELSDIVNIDSDKMKFDKINDELSEWMQRDSYAMGIEVEQVFVKRIMLPYENTIAVYDRMRAERDRIAKKYLAEGEEEALKIRAEADRISREYLSEARKKASVIRGKADASAMNTYAESYNKDLSFYEFTRSLQAYEKIFNEKSIIVLDDKSPILKTMFSGEEKK